MRDDETFVAWGETFEAPGAPGAWYVVPWGPDGPEDVETIHATAAGAYTAAVAAARAADTAAVYVDELGPVGGAWIAACGQAGWGILHETHRHVCIADGHATEADAWRAAGMEGAGSRT
jgi:hypothetical protein